MPETRPVAFRLPLPIYEIVERRARRKRLKVSEYLKGKVEYDTKRPH